MENAADSPEIRSLIADLAEAELAQLEDICRNVPQYHGPLIAAAARTVSMVRAERAARASRARR